MRIMCAGDSITLGIASPVGLVGGYRRHVMNRYHGARFVGGVHAYEGTAAYGQCEGYGGASTATIRANVVFPNPPAPTRPVVTPTAPAFGDSTADTNGSISSGRLTSSPSSRGTDHTGPTVNSPDDNCFRGS